MKRFLTLTALLFSINFAFAFNDYTQGYDFTNQSDALRFYDESTKVRWLKVESTKPNASPELKRKAQQFINTIEGVQDKAAISTIQELSANPKYQGKTIVHDSFRQAGATGINTDNDVRFGFYEGDRFVEIDMREAADKYYKNYAKEAGFEGNLNDKKAVAEFSGKKRQVTTSKAHGEACLDYTDQNSKGRGNIWDVKKGKSALIDPEGLGRMYYEKGNEQQRQADDLYKKLKDNPNMPQSEKAKLQNQIYNNESESVAQIKKGVKTLEGVEKGYKKQGYTGLPKTSKEFQNVSDAIKKYNSTAGEDLCALKKVLTDNGFKNIDDFNQKLAANLEGFKFAKPPKHKSFKLTPPPKPGPKMGFAGGVAGIINDVMAIDKKIEMAKKDQNWLVNFNDDDDGVTTAGKALIIAAGELEPFGILDSAERGFNIDEKIKNAIEIGIQTGKPLSDAEIAALMLGGAIFETGNKLIVEPGKMIKEFGEETYNYFIGNPLSEYSANSAAEEAQEQLEDAREEANKRKVNFDLYEIFKHSVDGSLVYAGLKTGDSIVLSVGKNPAWDNNHIAQWKLITPSNAMVLQELITSAENANVVKLTIPKYFNTGDYRVELKITETLSGKFVDRTSTTFKVAEKPFKFTPVQIFNRTNNSKISGVIKNEIPLGFIVGTNAQWRKDVTIEWLLDSSPLKTINAAAKGANFANSSTIAERDGVHTIAIRAVKDGQIIDYASATYKVKLTKNKKDEKKDKEEEQKENPDKEKQQGSKEKSSVQDGDLNEGDSLSEEEQGQSEQPQEELSNDNSGNDDEWDDWGEEAGDDPITSSSNDYDHKEFKPDSGTVGNIINQVEIIGGWVQNSISGSNQDGQNAEIENALAIKNINEQAAEDAEEIIGQHKIAMEEINNSFPPTNGGSPSFNGIETSGSGGGNVPYYDPTGKFEPNASGGSGGGYGGSSQGESLQAKEDAAQRAKEDKLAGELKAILDRRDQIVGKMKSCQSSMVKKKQSLYRQYHLQYAREMISKSGAGACGGSSDPAKCNIGNAGRGECGKKAKEATGYLGHNLYDGPSHKYYVSFQSCVPYLNQLKSINDEIYRYHVELGVKYRDGKFWFRDKNGKIWSGRKI